MKNIYFYSPHLPVDLADFPDTVSDSWQWFYEIGRPQLNMPDGEYAWTVQTFLYLKEAGVSCKLTNTMPEAGIVLAHRESVQNFV